MRVLRREFLHLGASATVLAALSRVAGAQSYPMRPVRLIVGLAAGGPTDVVARIVAEWLSQHFGQQFIVENRTGMGGNLANQAVVNSPADGYTLLFGGPTITIGASLYKKLPFNVLQDLAPVASLMRLPNLMVVPISLSVKSVPESVAYAKANPGQLSMASSGAGATPHLSGELFKFMAKIDMVHVPYRGSSAAYPDLLTGKVHVLFDNLGGPVLDMVRTGKLRLLGVTSASRWASLPDIPAIAETVPGYEVNVWYGIVAPRNTPAQAVETLNIALNTALAEPKVIARLAESGGMPMPMTIGEFGKFIADDLEKWRRVVEFAGISAD